MTTVPLRRPGSQRRQMTENDLNNCSWSETARFSAWTPITNKELNKQQISTSGLQYLPSLYYNGQADLYGEENVKYNTQLFQERTTLILHWFDLWTDGQRKHFLHLLFGRCSESQLKFASDYVIQTVPVTRLNFTTVLPRFLSLYILSFLNPMDLCAAAQVCWYWKFLTEQDCLWAPKCVRQGWFLTYRTSDNEYGAWKKHYVACACSLDFLSPREAADIYGTLNETLIESEEKDERQTERSIRRAIREKIAQYKKADLKNRRAWLTNSLSEGMCAKSTRQESSLTAALVRLGDKCRLENMSSIKEHRAELKSVLNSTNENTWCNSPMKALSTSLHSISSVRSNNPPSFLLLLVSTRLPAYELVLCGALANVVPLLYDYNGMSLEALYTMAERAVQRRAIQSIGIMAKGNPEEIQFLEGLSITERTILKPNVRAFWEKLCNLMVPAKEAGSLDIFVPLAASVAGMELISKLSALTGLRVRAPRGICTGSYQHILSEWMGRGEFPPLLYLNEGPLLSWCRQADRMEQALQVLRKHQAQQLQIQSHEIRSRTLGQFLWDHINLPVMNLKSEVIQVLIEGLVAVLKETMDNPLEFLGKFLLNKGVECNMEKSDPVILPESRSYSIKHLNSSHEAPKGLLGDADWRNAVATELLSSEKAYVRLIQAIYTVYYVPLRAALDSNRAIISSANLLMVFCPLLDILEANSVFLQDLTKKLNDWSPLQCIGDVFVKFFTNLRAYTNFFNNYPTAIKIIDKCTEMLPAFRAFLSRHNGTLATRMLSLQELFLSPSSRVEEYVNLLQCLLLHTPSEHPDHANISSALSTLLNYRNYIRKLKESLSQEQKMLEVQKTIQSCPNLQEESRYLITVQDVELLSCINEDIVPALRMYECVGELGLFLFNDALVLSERRESHVPFALAVNVSHTFLASIALHSLTVSEIVDTKYVQNAFHLEGPTRKWICTTSRKVDKIRCLGALHTAINAAKNN